MRIFKCGRYLAFSAILGAALLFTGCGAPSSHPGEINSLDGSTYDSLTAAHAALSTCRIQVSTTYPTYVSEFNQAVSSYAAAYDSYILFRSAPTSNQAQLALEIQNLTISVVALEDAFQAGMKPSPADVAAVHKRAEKILATLKAKKNISISDILTELQIAAGIAETIPGTGPYASLAALVISATNSAISTISANQGQPIDLSTIQPIAPLSTTIVAALQ
jgi:hypothetical protein